jgi:DNA repair exonuclease SbcCD ATPase subunit
MKDDEIEQLKENEKRLAQQIQKTKQELENKERKFADEITTKNSENATLRRSQRELTDENTELTSEIQSKKKQIQELRGNEQTLAARIEIKNQKYEELKVMALYFFKYEMLYVKKNMTAIDKNHDDSKTFLNISQKLQEGLIRLSLWRYFLELIVNETMIEYNHLEHGCEKKLKEILPKQDYDSYKHHHRMVLNTLINVLSTVENPKTYESTEKKYEAALDEAMNKIGSI